MRCPDSDQIVSGEGVVDLVNSMVPRSPPSAELLLEYTEGEETSDSHVDGEIISLSFIDATLATTEIGIAMDA